MSTLVLKKVGELWRRGALSLIEFVPASDFHAALALLGVEMQLNKTP